MGILCCKEENNNNNLNNTIEAKNKAPSPLK